MSEKSQKIKNPRDDLFLKLHQLQINLIKTTTKQAISEYKCELVEIFSDEKPLSNDPTSDELTKLVEFLIFPVLTACKRLQNEAELRSRPGTTREWSDLNQLLLECLYLVLNKIKLSNLNLFHDILTTCSMLLSRNKLVTKKTEDTTRLG